MNFFLTSQTGKLLTNLGYRDSIYHAFSARHIRCYSYIKEREKSLFGKPADS